MNGQEQKERQTAVTQLRRDFDKLENHFTDAYGVEVESRLRAATELELKLTQLIREAVSVEHTFVLRMADEQRAYVDRADKDTNALILACAMMPTWKRHLWCVFGGRAVQRVEAWMRRWGQR